MPGGGWRLIAQVWLSRMTEKITSAIGGRPVDACGFGRGGRQGDLDWRRFQPALWVAVIQYGADAGKGIETSALVAG